MWTEVLEMYNTVIIIFVAAVISIMLTAVSPGLCVPNQQPDNNPWPKEVNRGEPTMEKIYFDGWIDLQYGTPPSELKWSQIYHPGGNLYFMKNNAVYTWFDYGAYGSKYLGYGLCRWRYLYDSVHEW